MRVRIASGSLFAAQLGTVAPRKEGGKGPRRDLEGNEERKEAMVGPPG